MLDIRHHDSRGVEVELLYRVVGPQGEERSSWAIDGEAPDDVEGWDRVVGDVLGPNIP